MKKFICWIDDNGSLLMMGSLPPTILLLFLSSLYSSVVLFIAGFVVLFVCISAPFVALSIVLKNRWY